MKLPGFLNRKEKANSGSQEPVLNSVTNCSICPSGLKSAKLLIVTGQWNFYYCYRCRRWSRSHYSEEKEDLHPIEDARMQKSLTWFWMTESELMEENLRAMAWLGSIFTGKNYGEEKKSNLV